MIRNVNVAALERMRTRLNRLYGPQEQERLLERLVALVGRYGIGLEGYSKAPLWDETTSLLITYGDAIRHGDEPALRALKRFADDRLRGAIHAIHLLPFFPYSSDDGFSVIDYRTVDPRLGTWNDVRELGRGFRLMFDLVLNHVSRRSKWFADYLAGIAPYRDYFLSVDPDVDLSAVVRPRALPLLTTVRTLHGEAHLWTTFSEDQIDLDFSNPDVLFEFLDVLFFYLSNGASIIRLDAIAYLWKQIGTSCIHLPQTHEVVRLLRDLLDMVAPETVLLTETNVPHEENVSYFGNGDEAHAIYQFPLPPLLLHALLSGDASALTRWASGLGDLPPKCTYLNFTASHDGIGVRPLRGLIPDAEIDRLAEEVKARGGLVSYKTDSDGSQSPYELNVTYFDALSDDPETVTDLHVERFLCSQTISMALQGIPALYFHSLVATRNDYAGLERTGRARSINRRKFSEEELDALLADSSSVPARVLSELVRRLRLRSASPSFHPDAPQTVVDLGPKLFCIVRERAGRSVVSISNVSAHPLEVRPGQRIPSLDLAKTATDLLTGQRFMGDGKVIPLAPYQTVWLHPENGSA